MFSAVVAVLLVIAAGVQLWMVELLFETDEDLERFPSWYGSIAQRPDELPLVATSPVSVLICAANEAQNLAQHLPRVLDQYFPDQTGAPAFEVIVVNDRSTDDSLQVLRSLSGTHSNLRIIDIDPETPRRFPGKKDALSRGLAAASHDVILMTDADCRPASTRWISWMAFPFGAGREIVGGYGGYDAAPGLLNRFIQCETVHTFAQYSGWTRLGKPYMAVGRNLACRKDMLLRAQSDPLWTKTASGDDDLLIRICATPGNMVVNDHPDSHTYSPAKATWRDYLHQKQRHMSTGKLYRPSIQRRLGTYALSHSFTWILMLIFVVDICSSRYSFNLLFGLAPIVGLIVIMRFSLFSARLHALATTLSPANRRLRYFWPIFDLLWMLYNIVLSPYILWKTKQRWK